MHDIGGDNILYGMLSGMVVGALGGIGGGGLFGAAIAGVASSAGAFTMSLIGDDVNGRQRRIDKALVSGATAGIFGFLGSGFSSIVSGEGAAVMAIWNTVCSFIFNSYTFVADLIYDKFIRGNGNATQKQTISV